MLNGVLHMRGLNVCPESCLFDVQSLVSCSNLISCLVSFMQPLVLVKLSD